MSLDLTNLEQTYQKFYEVSLQIGELIERELYDELITYMSKKDKLLYEAGILIQKIKEKNEDTKLIEEICTKIQKQELANISALTVIRDGVKKELNKTSKSSKLVGAYSNAEFKQGNILDFSE